MFTIIVVQIYQANHYPRTRSIIHLFQSKKKQFTMLWIMFQLRNQGFNLVLENEQLSFVLATTTFSKNSNGFVFDQTSRPIDVNLCITKNKTNTTHNSKNTNNNNIQHMFLIKQIEKKVQKPKFIINSITSLDTLSHTITHSFSNISSSFQSISGIILHYLKMIQKKCQSMPCIIPHKHPSCFVILIASTNISWRCY